MLILNLRSITLHRIRYLTHILLVFLVLGIIQAQSINDITFITEQYPPYNFEKDGQLQGIAIELIEAVFEQVQSGQTREDVNLWPWSRGYDTTLSTPNHCLFSTTRTEAREPLFAWVGPISPTVIGLTARKDGNVAINSVEEVSNYGVGVIGDDIGEQLLANQGIDHKNLERVRSTLQNIQKLNRNRIQLISYEVNVLSWEIKSNDFDPSDYEVAHVLQEAELYIACNKETSPEVLQTMQAAFDTIASTGQHQQILDNYLK